MARFPDGARVCFVGDSLTATFNYEGLIAAFYRDNFRDSKVRIYNCGVAGGRAASQLAFLEKDTLIHKPTHAVVMLGVNDSARWILQTEKTEQRFFDLVRAYEKYKVDLPALCDALEQAGAEIILCTPAPYAEYQDSPTEPLKGGYALVAGYAEFCRQLAKERSYPLCDIHSYLTQLLQTEAFYNDDRVHPNDRGQYYIAKHLLEFQGLDLGEQKPVPEEFSELVRECMILRDILSAKINVIGKYDLPEEENKKIVKEYLDADRAPSPYHKRIAETFLQHVDHWDEQMAKVRKLTDELMG